MTSAVPMATGSPSPVWPLPDVTRKRWTFGASRAKGKRRHAGVDLYAPRGSVVLSPEDGRVVAWQKFKGPRAHALLIQLDSGPVVLLGEVEPGSWAEFGLGIGSRVIAGQVVATVGINPGGSQMLHYEMYASGTRQNHQWYAGQRPPAQLRNPTHYLQSANALDADQSDDPGDDSDDAGDVAVDDDVDDIVASNTDELPDTHPTSTARSGSAILGLGLIFLIGSAMGDR